MNPEEQLRRVVSQRKTNKPSSTTKLSDALAELLEKHISPKQSCYEFVKGVWDEILPAELTQHTSIDQIERGNLKICVDSPSYMYELKLCSSKLLRYLQQRCVDAKIRKITFVTR